MIELVKNGKTLAEGKYIIEKKPSSLKWILMFAFPVCLFILCLFLGRYTVSPGEVFSILGYKLLNLPIEPYWSETAVDVVIRVRLPRAIMAALIGAGLSMSGASFQGMFQNPLVSPFILGVSAGASFGAALGLVFELPDRRGDHLSDGAYLQGHTDLDAGPFRHGRLGAVPIAAVADQVCG
jgi:ABC-type enterobactin transport system permease subunit